MSWAIIKNKQSDYTQIQCVPSKLIRINQSMDDDATSDVGVQHRKKKLTGSNSTDQPVHCFLFIFGCFVYPSIYIYYIFFGWII